MSASATTGLELAGDRALVTASGGGIGRRIADSLLEAGVDVVLNDVDADALDGAVEDLSTRDAEVASVPGDASDPDVADSLVDTAVAAFGGLDVVVNNVGVAGPTAPCEEISSEEFMETLEVNLGSAFAVSRAAIPHLREGAAGRVVNVSSMSGKRPLRDRTPYATSKMGVIGFTRTLAVELADDDVTVNAVCPGSVDGPRLRAVIEGQAESRGRPVDEVTAEFRDVIPQGGFVTADDVADAVLFLCSTRAARMTGQDLNVTGGTAMY